MIDKLVIHRFRGIRQGVLENFGRLNLLVGPNNSGKTAVLEMLYLLGVSGRGGSLLAENLSSADVPEAYVPLPSDFLGYKPLPRLWRRHGKPAAWEASPGKLTEQSSLIYNLPELPKEHPLRSFRLILPPSERVEDYGGFNQEDVETNALFVLPFAEGFPEGFPPELLPAGMQNEVVTDTAATRLAYLWYPPFVNQSGNQGVAANNHTSQPPDDYSSLAVWSLRGALPAPDHVLLFDFHAAHDHLQLPFFQFAYQLPDWPDRIAAAMAGIFPEMDNCRVEFVPADALQTGMVGHIRLPGQRPLPIDAFGDGARHAFKVLAALTALVAVADEEHPALFLWEEPEAFQNPVTLERLLAEVVDIMHGNPIQVFIASHSLEVIAHVTTLLQRGRLAAEDTLLFQLNLSDGALLSAWFDVENLTAWLESGMDPRIWNLDDFELPVQFHLREEAE
ncbi:MAG: AAA family ATPase [Chloroflexaceae bacterium]